MTLYLLVRSDRMNQAARTLGGTTHDLLADRASTLIEDTRKNAAAIDANAKLTPAGKGEARAELQKTAAASVAAIFAAPSRDLAQRIANLRTQGGFDRKLNLADADIRGSALDAATADAINRVHVERVRVRTIKGAALQALLRDAFGAAEGTEPDPLTAYAVDSLSRHDRTTLAAEGGVDLDELRRTFLERRNPSGAAQVRTLEEVGGFLHGLGQSAARGVEEALGLAGIGGTQVGGAVDVALGELRAALRMK